MSLCDKCYGPCLPHCYKYNYLFIILSFIIGILIDKYILTPYLINKINKNKC